MRDERAEPNWVPLERLAEAAAGAGLQLNADDLDGRCLVVDGERIELYKHVDTRRYLNVDAAGHAYRYTGGRYEPWRSPVPAIAVRYERWSPSAGRMSTLGSCAPYERGDQLVASWCDVVGVHDPISDVQLEVLAEVAWPRHNRDDRPDGQLCPAPISVGDVVVFGAVVLSLDSADFATSTRTI